MAATADLKAAVTESLENNGTLQQLRAKEIAQPLSRDNLIINELLREYLMFNGYRNTLSVLLPETRQPQTAPFDREFLADKLGIQESATTCKVPLLYALIANSSNKEQAPAIDQIT